MGTGPNFCKHLTASPIAHDCVPGVTDTVKIDGAISDAYVREVAASTGDGAFPRLHFVYEETIKIIPGWDWPTYTVSLPGTYTWDETNQVVLFEIYNC